MKKQLLIIAFILQNILLLTAQKTISGTVKDENGETLPDAVIVIKGTNIGTLTDTNGYYSIKLKNILDTLVVSYMGFESKEVIPFEKEHIDIELESGFILPEFVKVAFNTSLRCGGCCCCFYTWYQSANIETWTKPIKATPLSYGATKLDFEINVSWIGQMNAYFKEYYHQKVYYRISKSTDDFNYHLIGKSESDTLTHILKDNGNVKALFGGSQFLDKEKNTAPTTYYKVEGYILKKSEDEDEEIEPEKVVVFNEKISVDREDFLKINSIYADNQTPQLKIDISSPTDNQDTEFIISDISGRILTRQHHILFKQNNTLFLNAEQWASGVYILSVKQGMQSDSQKFRVIH